MQDRSRRRPAHTLLAHRLGVAIATGGYAPGAVLPGEVELAEQNGILRGHTSFVYDVAFSPDGVRVASASWDGCVG